MNIGSRGTTSPLQTPWTRVSALAYHRVFTSDHLHAVISIESTIESITGNAFESLPVIFLGLQAMITSSHSKSTVDFRHEFIIMKSISVGEMIQSPLGKFIGGDYAL